jgi:hypothetical protein
MNMTLSTRVDYSTKYISASQIQGREPEQNSGTALPSVVGRWSGFVNKPSTGVKITPLITSSDYQLLSNPLIRSDFEATLSLEDISTSSGPGIWELEEDITLPFRPKKTVKLTVTMRYAGKLKPGKIDLDEDWPD